MSSLLLNSEPINLDIEPATFAAHTLNPFGMRVGMLKLEIDREGFRLFNKKGRMVSTISWYELEELKNEVRDKGRFSFRGTLHTGLNEVQALIRVGLNDDRTDWERLADIFDKLPQDAFGLKCPACSGAVVANVCKNCGQSFTGQQRRKGLKFILIGGILLAFGITLTSATYNPSNGSMWLFFGPIIIGGALIVGGLIGLIFGKRV